jgi:hypothetical protein
LIIYGPKFFKAKNDRRHNETKERLDDHEQKQTELEKVVLEQRKTIDDMNIRILEIQGLKPTP